MSSSEPKLTREGALEIEDAGNEKSSGFLPEDLGDIGLNEEDEMNLPPGRLHSILVEARLSGSIGNMNVQSGSLHSSSGSAPRRKLHGHHRHGDGTRSPGSRSKSPSIRDRGTVTTLGMGDSSISSLEDFVDSDILYDRAGLIDDLSQASSGNNKKCAILPSVNERLSEETLEDSQAFSDVVFRSSNASRAASVGTDRELFLDPLDEIDEEGGDGDDSLEDPSEHESQQVILVNMDKIAISQPSPDLGASHSALARGSSSVLEEEAPVEPGA
jgi:hypothetical protein